MRRFGIVANRYKFGAPRHIAIGHDTNRSVLSYTVGRDDQASPASKYLSLDKFRLFDVLSRSGVEVVEVCLGHFDKLRRLGPIKFEPLAISVAIE